MSSENAVDDGRVPSQRRPLGTALAVRAEAGLDGFGDAVVWVARELVPAAPMGAEQLARDWKWWVDARQERAEVEQRVQRAKDNGAGAMPVPFKEVATLRKERKRASWLITTALLLGLAFLSVLGHWSWEQWRWCGPAATFLQLVVGKYFGQRWLMRTAAVWLPVFLAALGVTGWSWWPWWSAAFLLLTACVVRGLVMAKEEEQRSARGYRPGDAPSWPRLWNTADDVMRARGKVIERGDATAPISAFGDEVGVDFELHCDDPITGEDVRALERQLGFVANGSSWVPNPRAAGSGNLRVCWRDPLPPSTAPRREPLSLRYTSRFTVCHREGGRATALNIARQKVFLAGNSGAGKSEAMQELLDAVCNMRDARWVGIDVTESATLRQFKGQWNCDGVATTHSDALALLQGLRVECKRRNKLLDEGMDADLDGRMDQWWIVTDEPGRHGIVLFVDELAALTSDRDCAEELVHLYDECRKASMSIVVATPDMDTKRVPPPCRDQSGIKVGFSMPFSDAVLLFGKGATQAGWEPFHLIPADEDEPNDAGKSFVLGNGYNRPELHRWPHMPSDEVVTRNVARREYLERVGQPISPRLPEPDIVDAEIVTEADVAREAAIRRALTLCGDREGLPVKELSASLTSEEEALVRAAAPPKSVYLASANKPVRCVPRSALVSALSED